MKNVTPFQSYSFTQIAFVYRIKSFFFSYRIETFGFIDKNQIFIFLISNPKLIQSNIHFFKYPIRRMSASNIFRSTEYAVALTLFSVFGVLRLFCSCGLLSYIPLALGAYILYNLLASKKIEGNDQFTVI